MPGVSPHAVDVARGRAAAGMRVEIFALEPARRRIAHGDLTEAGTLDHPVTGEALAPGLYEAVFHVGAYLGGAEGFLDEVPFRFRVADPAEHYHLPLKFTPWGYSLFRGS